MRLWNAATRSQLAALRGNGSVTSVAFSPDGRTLASAGFDGTVRLCNAATGTQLAVLHGHTGTVASVAFSPDGRTLAGAGADHTVRLWNEVLWSSVDEAHAAVCDILLAGLTRSNWAQYAPGIPYQRTCPN